MRIFRHSSGRGAAFTDERNVFILHCYLTPKKVIDVDVLGEENFHLDALRYAHFSGACSTEQERVVPLVVDTQLQQMLAAEVVGSGAVPGHHQSDVVELAVHAIEVGKVEPRRQTEQDVDRDDETRAAERRCMVWLTSRRPRLNLSHEEQT